MDPKLKKKILTALKLLVSLGLMFWVLTQMDWAQIRMMSQKSSLSFLVLAVVFFLLSQLVSVLRFDLFLREAGVRISFSANSKLYLLGMFYNFFIPGGVGGDTYKAYILSKTQNKPLKSLGEAVFVDRLIGLAAIGFMACILAGFISFPIEKYWKWFIIFVGFAVIGTILKLTMKFFHIHKKQIYPGFLYSVVVQILQMISVWCILKSFDMEGNSLIYLLMFLISSVLSVISFAGLGVREAVFYYGGVWFDFNPDLSAGVALSFSLITALVAFFGIKFQFGGLNLKK